MTIAHLGSSLGIKDSAMSLPEGMILFPFDRGVYSTPIDVPVLINNTTSRPDIRKFRNAVGIEDSTTNLFTNGDFSTWSTTGWTFLSWSAANYSTNVIEAQNIHFPSALRIDRLASGGSADFHQGNKFIVGKTYTVSFWVRGDGNMTINAQWTGNGVLKDIPLSHEWQFIHHTFTVGGTAGQYMFLRANDISSFLEITGIQVEERDHWTTFVNGSRNVGCLKFDISSLNMSGAGCVSCWIYASSSLVRNLFTQSGVNNQYIIKMGSYKYNSWYDDVMSLWSQTEANRRFRFWVSRTVSSSSRPEAQIFSSKLMTDYVTENSWNHFVIQWDKNGLPSGNNAEMYINGKLDSGISTSSLPDNKLTYLHLGQWHDNGDLMPCTFFEQLAIHPSRGFSPQIIANWYNSNAPFYDANDSYLIL